MMARSPLGFAAALAALLAPSALLAQEVVTLPANDTPVDPVATEVYAVGGFDAVGWDAFGSVSQIEFDGEGNLYIFDRQASQISVVSPEGELLRQFGEAGEGPGELRSPGSMGVTRDGRVFVQDAGHRAYLEYDRAGEFVKQIPMNIVGNTVVMGSLTTDPTQAAFFSGGGGRMMISMTREGPGDVNRPEVPNTRPINRVTLGSSVETESFFDAWSPPPAASSSSGSITAGGIRIPMAGMSQRIWLPSVRYGALPDGGIALSDSSGYAVKVIDGSGRHLRTVTRPSVRPVQVTDRIRTGEIERRLAEIDAGEGPQMRIVTDNGSGAQAMPQTAIREMQKNRLEDSEFWPEIPVVAGLSVGWEWADLAGAVADRSDRARPDRPL